MEAAEPTARHPFERGKTEPPTALQNQQEKRKRCQQVVEKRQRVARKPCKKSERVANTRHNKSERGSNTWRNKSVRVVNTWRNKSERVASTWRNKRARVVNKRVKELPPSGERGVEELPTRGGTHVFLSSGWLLTTTGSGTSEGSSSPTCSASFAAIASACTTARLRKIHERQKKTKLCSFCAALLAYPTNTELRNAEQHQRK
jgi:hypothetical protein